MYAIVECGGRQYRAEEGHSFSVEKLPHEVGEQIELDNVLLLSNDGDVTIGRPTITGASVTATVTDQYRGKKIFVWKYKPKKRYRRRRGHRQYYTRLRIDSISVNGNGGVKVANKAQPVEAAPAIDEPTIIDTSVAEAAAKAKVAEEKAAAKVAADAKAVEKEAAKAKAAADAKIAEEKAATEAKAVADAKVAEEKAAVEAIATPEPTVVTQAPAEDKTLLLDIDEDLLPSDEDLGLVLDTDDKTLLLEADDDLVPSDDELMGFMESASAAESSDKTLIMEPDNDLIPDELEMAGLVADGKSVDSGAVPAPDFEGTVMLDDLTLIEGIGPKIQTTLQSAGILTMAELSVTSKDRLHEIVKEAGISAHPESWPEQARIAATGDMDALKAYQDTLDGGVAH